MRLLVTGDFHITESRLLEVTDILNQILIHLKDCDGIAILGDIFNHAIPNDKEIDCFVAFINSIPSNKIIYLITGNHDNSRDSNSISWVHRIHSKINYSKHCITTLIEGKKVMMIHASVAESKMGPEDYQIGNKSVIDYNNIDIVLSGHIHKGQIVHEFKPLFIHPGSPYHINFGERNDKKGIYFLDINKEITYKFIPLDTIPMLQLDIKDLELNKLEAKLDTLDKKLKLKIIFNITSNELEKTAQINKIIKECQKVFHMFKYDYRINKQKITVDTTKSLDTTRANVDIVNLLKSFCRENKVDKEVYQLLANLLR